ncbi:Hypothetical protein D9617_7g029420 [Elsinoe fawcettii]|nr:Hypothetical protein D9617_7g029420 [Elsinoe fawcettii]
MKKLRHEDYQIGWICPLLVEQLAARCMLDEIHESLPQPSNDDNIYELGEIYGHNVVLCPLPRAGNVIAASSVTQMLRTFTNLKFSLLVGIGGGVPTKSASGRVKLGDIVIGTPTGQHSGTIQYDHGKAEQSIFQRTGQVPPPPKMLLLAADKVEMAIAWD